MSIFHLILASPTRYVFDSETPCIIECLTNAYTSIYLHVVQFASKDNV